MSRLKKKETIEKNRLLEFQGGRKEKNNGKFQGMVKVLMEFQGGRKEKNNGKFQGVVKVLMEFQGEKRKKQWKIPGGSQSFNGIPGGKKEKTMENSRGW